MGGGEEEGGKLGGGGNTPYTKKTQSTNQEM